MTGIHEGEQFVEPIELTGLIRKARGTTGDIPTGLWDAREWIIQQFHAMVPWLAGRHLRFKSALRGERRLDYLTRYLNGETVRSAEVMLDSLNVTELRFEVCDGPPPPNEYDHVEGLDVIMDEFPPDEDTML
ncbi:MAG: hypothetical protein ABIA47_04720 [bacterium]